MASVYLCGKMNKGTCRVMRGQIRIHTVFVNSPGYVWSQRDIETFNTELNRVTDHLVKEARSSGVALNFTKASDTLTMPVEIAHSNGDDVKDAYMNKYGCASMEELYSRISGKTDKNGGMQTVLIFASKNEGRAFAFSTCNEAVEYIFVFGAKCNSLLHEILHLFGAKDYYYPAEIAEAARRLFPDSVMLKSASPVIDSLTRYLIGWTDTLTDEAEEMLRIASAFTQEQIDEMINGLWESDNAVISDEVATYYGPVREGFKNGKGRLEYRNGSLYEGDFVNSKKHGKGRMVYENGTVYEGDYVNGKRQGRGKMIYYDKSVYEGEFFENKCHGKGRMVYANGNVYEGDFANDTFHGKGKMIYADTSVYEGDYVNGLRQGRGKMIYYDKSVYEGEFFENKCHGKGRIVYANGNVYEGDFANDTFHGKGKMIYADMSVYEGDFVNGERQGRGKLIYANMSVYEGGFAGGKCHGKGKMIYSNMSVYEGDFVKGKRQGRGKLIYHDMSVYEGELENGVPHGTGKLIYRNGTVRKGIFSKGKYIGEQPSEQ